jgi:hypothetical protein
MMLFLSAGSAADAQSGVPYTLHVNVRLLQVPTLVLGPRGQLVPGIEAKKFNIRLDSGRSFRPSEARLEGDDPIMLSVLLDLSGSETGLIRDLGQDLPSWITGSFKPTDRIAFYGVDCTLVRTKGYLPPDAAVVQQAFDNVIHSAKVHGTKSKPACGRSVALWNAIAVVSQQNRSLPGWHVMLVITGGYDGHSSLTFPEVEQIASNENVTIFGLSQPSTIFAGEVAGKNFSSLCERTGGFFAPAYRDLPDHLSWFVKMLRGRYILEFTEPANAPAGNHRIDISIDGMTPFIRPGAVAAAVDPAAAKDPTLVPQDTAGAPQLGKSRPHDP